MPPSSSAKTPLVLKKTTAPRAKARTFQTPRTLKSRVSSGMSPKDVSECSKELSRNISDLARFVLTNVKSDVIEYNGKSFTQAEFKNYAKTMASLVPELTTAAGRRNKKSKPELSAAERESRQKELIERSQRGVGILTQAMQCEKLAPRVNQMEEARIKALAYPTKPTVSHISSPFFVSDQLRDFFRHADLGNGIALLYSDKNLSDATKKINGSDHPAEAVKAVEKELEIDVAKDLKVTKKELNNLADPRIFISALIDSHGIVTSPLLMSMMAWYIFVNNLKDTDGRIKTDENMLKHFGGKSTTQLTFEGKALGDLTSETSASGLARLRKRQPKKEGLPVPYNGKTFVRSMTIALVTMYRIPDSLVSDDMRRVLSASETNNLAIGVKAIF